MPENNHSRKSSAEPVDSAQPETLTLWSEGLRVFSQVTGWIVAPLILALYGGRYLDEKYEMTNVYFLVLTGVAFIISSVGIARMGVRYIRMMEDESKKSNDVTKHGK